MTTEVKALIDALPTYTHVSGSSEFVPLDKVLELVEKLTATKTFDVDFAGMVISTLEVKALDGCKNMAWSGFENGNGEEVGKEIDELIKTAKMVINSLKAQTE